MNTKDYELFVDNLTPNSDDRERLYGFGLGLAGECGEVLELLKRQLTYGVDISSEDVKKELGDVLWYLTAISLEYNTSLDEVMKLNVQKLSKRYPNGFDPLNKKRQLNE